MDAANDVVTARWPFPIMHKVYSSIYVWMDVARSHIDTHYKNIRCHNTTNSDGSGAELIPLGHLVRMANINFT